MDPEAQFEHVTVAVDGLVLPFAALLAAADPYLLQTLRQAVSGTITCQEFATVYALAHRQEFRRSIIADLATPLDTAIASLRGGDQP